MHVLVEGDEYRRKIVGVEPQPRFGGDGDAFARAVFFKVFLKTLLERSGAKADVFDDVDDKGILVDHADVEERGILPPGHSRVGVYMFEHCSGEILEVVTDFRIELHRAFVVAAAFDFRAEFVQFSQVGLAAVVKFRDQIDPAFFHRIDQIVQLVAFAFINDEISIRVRFGDIRVIVVDAQGIVAERSQPFGEHVGLLMRKEKAAHAEIGSVETDRLITVSWVKEAVSVFNGAELAGGPVVHE